MPLVSQRDKQIALRDAIKTAADRHKTGLTLETHHRLAAEFDVVSPRIRDKVMGDPNYYCEVLPAGSPTDESLTKGSPSAVAHAFDVWLVLEYEEAGSYSGSTQETFDNLTESLSPKGILPELRARSSETVNGNLVTFQDPTGADPNIVPLGERGGSFDRAHRLRFEITLTEPS